MSDPFIIDLTSVEPFAEGGSGKAMPEMLRSAGFYDVIEVSRHEDITKICEMLKFLPDSQEIAYVVAILDNSE